MGERGPVGKRSDRRLGHRTQAEKDRVTKADAGAAEVEAPPARDSWHELAQSWYESLAVSGQARFYEESDWWAAQWCAELMTEALEAERPAPLAAQVRSLMVSLLVTEGDRRRVSLELQRPAVDAGDDEVVAELDEYRRRTGSRAG